MASDGNGGREIVTEVDFVKLTKLSQLWSMTLTPLSRIMKKPDTRIILHTKEASDQGYERLVVRCKYTDVLVPLTYISNELCQEIWMQKGSFKSPNKNIIMCSFKSSRAIQKKEGGPDSCFELSILFSDPE